MLCMHAILSHVTRIWRAPNTRLARQLRSWRVPISILSVGARRVTSWRAKCPVGARQVQFWRAPSWRAPSPVLALELNYLGFIRSVVWLVFVLSWLSHCCPCVHCSVLVQCDLAYLQVPIHYANFQLEVDPRPVPVPAGAEQLEGQPQEQRQEQQEGVEVDVDVEVDWEVPEVPEPADFRDDLHSPDKFLKVMSAEATALDPIDGGGTRISRLFQAQVIRRGSGLNRVVECPFWAVVQGKAGVVSVSPFVQVRPPSTHNRLLLCSIDALGQLQRWKQCEWSDVRAIASAPHLKEAAQAFLLRFQKQLVRRGRKGEKVGRAGSDASGNPSLQSKGRTEQQARGSRRPRPTTTPQEAAQAAHAAGDGGGAWEEAEILRLEEENKLLRQQLKAAETARKTAQ